MSIWVKFSKKFRFSLNFRKSWILVKFLKKNRFWSCFGKKVRFWSKFPKNVDFFGNFEKNSILSNFRKNFEFGQNLRKTFFLEFGKNSILVKFSNISILIMIFEKNLKKLRFWTKLAKIFEKCRF